MRRYYTFFVNRPLLVNVIMAACIIGGIMAVQTMKVDTMPKFDLGIVNITTFRPGASPEDPRTGAGSSRHGRRQYAPQPDGGQPQDGEIG